MRGPPKQPQKVMPYANWYQSVPPQEPIHADRISGGQLWYDQQDRPEWVTIQWQDGGEQLYHTLQMDFPNAMFLLSVLKSMQLDTGTPFPDDPRPRSRRGT